MITLTDVMDQVKLLTKEARTPPKGAIPTDVLQAAMVSLNGLIKAIQELKKPPPEKVKLTKKDMDAAKAQSISAQIYGFTSLDKEHKAFFTVDYFKRKFEAFPMNRERVASFIKGSKPSAYLNPIILYLSRPEHDSIGLHAFLAEIRSEYMNSPTVKRLEGARALFRKLLAEKDVNAIASALQASFPTEDQLKGFSKMVSVKIPAQSRRKGVPKKTPHQRLADAIYAEGAVVRMDLS